MTEPTVCFVTVSYGPDRDRCALLNRSLTRLAPSVEHIIVVDRGDRRHFEGLQSAQTTLVSTEDVLPLWLRRVNTRRLGVRSNAWVQTFGRPVRGWLMQQLVKLAVIEQLTTEVVVHADSDVVLLKPFTARSVSDHTGRVRLYKRADAIDENLPSHVLWHRAAEKLLGLPPASLPIADHVTSLVPWKRENALALLEHVAFVSGRHWLRAIAAQWDVSEYTLYGRFVTEILGEAAGQLETSSSLCRDYWTPTPLSHAELEAFLDDVEPEEVGVSITAKAGMRPADYAHLIEERWVATTP